MLTKLVKSNAVRRVGCSGCSQSLSVGSRTSAVLDAPAIAPVGSSAYIAVLTGLVTPFNTFSVPCGNHPRLRVHPLAFLDALAHEAPVVFTVNHDLDDVISRNVRLWTVDGLGLMCAVGLPDTASSHKLLASIDAGECTGMSFMYDVEKSSYARQSDASGKEYRHLRQLAIWEICAIVAPETPVFKSTWLRRAE